MFTATDKEMGHIEQPMEYLIERTNYKCKKCTKFFSNDVAVKQHQFESRIKMEKCLHCSKTINQAYNLEKRLRSCKKALTHPTKQKLH